MNETKEFVEKKVTQEKRKKRVHYSKDSFDELFTDTDDQNSGTSSGYYSESVKHAY